MDINYFLKEKKQLKEKPELLIVCMLLSPYKKRLQKIKKVENY
jgi:hypothetical protein